MCAQALARMLGAQGCRSKAVVTCPSVARYHPPQNVLLSRIPADSNMRLLDWSSGTTGEVVDTAFQG